MFAARHERSSLNVCRLLNVLEQNSDVHRVLLRDYRLLLNVSESFNTVLQRTPSSLSLRNCTGGVDLDKLLEVCNWCTALRDLEVTGSQLLAKAKGTRKTVHRNKTLEELSIQDCEGDLVQLLVMCSQCSNLKCVYMDCNQMLLDEHEVKFVKPLPGLKKFLYKKSYVRTPSGSKIDVSYLKQHFARVFPSARRSIEKTCTTDK